LLLLPSLYDSDYLVFVYFWNEDFFSLYDLVSLPSEETRVTPLSLLSLLFRFPDLPFFPGFLPKFYFV
jgi:hypothetical protein